MESKDKLIYIYGINPVYEAFKVSDALKEVYITRKKTSKFKEIIELAEKKSIPVKVVEESFIDSIIQGIHQGIAAKIKPKKTITIQEALKIPAQRNEPAFFLILDLIEDPQNFGAIMRVADAAGVHAVIYQQKRSVGIVPSIWKASAGAVWHINLVEINNIKYAIKALKDEGIDIIGAEADAEISLWQIDLKKPLAIITGSEGKGIRKTVKNLCSKLIKIPTCGKVNSLNVSVATGVIAFEVLRQRMKY